MDQGPDIDSKELHFHSCLRRPVLCNHNVGFFVFLDFSDMFFFSYAICENVSNVINFKLREGKLQSIVCGFAPY